MQGVAALFASIPVGGIFFGTLLLVLVAVEIGHRWARKRQQARDTEKEGPVGAMVGATLGLLAFLLAFTFGVVADAFHARRVALTEEVSAIHVCHELAAALPPADRDEIRAVLRRYVDERLKWSAGEVSDTGVGAWRELDRLWVRTAAVAAQHPGDVDVLLDSVGRITTLHRERTMVREQSRVPVGFWAVLYVVALLSMGAVGYHGGVAGSSRSPMALVVAIAFSAVMMVIADVDRPGDGIINVSQAPMLELRALLAESG